MRDLPSEEEMARMSWTDLQLLRVKYKDDPKTQQILAPFEHRAYARETVAANPSMAPLMALMVPGYQMYKGISGMLSTPDKDTTPVSLEQMAGGFKGTYEGLMQRMR